MTNTVFKYKLVHDTLANFNDWAYEFTTALSTIGLTQTADTGQVAFGSPVPAITLPGIGSPQGGGYQVWRFNDTLQSTYPIFMRFDFGTHDTYSACPGIYITVGTGSDGSGTITNPCTQTELMPTINPDQNLTRPWYFVYQSGFFAVHCGPQAMSSSWDNMGWFTMMLARSCNAVGAPSGDGLFLTSQHLVTGENTNTEANPHFQTYHYSDNVWYGDIGETPSAGGVSSWMLMPVPSNQGTWADTTDSTTTAFPAWAGNPRPFPIPQMLSLFTTDLKTFKTFTATAMGTTERTYLTLPWAAMGNPPFQCDETLLVNNYVGYAIEWE